MNRIKLLFEEKKKGICSIFVTAGYPHLESTVNTVLTLDQSGVDLIELGIPFSDPLADGETIQKTSELALKNGMSIELLLKQLKEIRKQSEIPIVLMGYFNPIYKYGLERFLNKAKEAGADGMIIPDLSIEDYERHYKPLFKKNDLPLTFLFTPKTPMDRLMRLVNETDTFLYYVSSASTTGKTIDISVQQEKNALEVFNLKIEVPILMGFGIHDAQTFDFACKYFQGGIVGSAFLRHLGEGKSIPAFVNQLKPQILKEV